ncbi:efflux RND transporter periplasmic adaptor subunit [Noviherbaspirillum sp. 1P10PC]|uniref:efflux RND transporter periplasmic adaptor subunit n=1 Tax=Noviherbaspirillum sp. 1P10PC TaxID=3132292 RepID=UPI00399F4C4D
MKKTVSLTRLAIACSIGLTAAQAIAAGPVGCLIEPDQVAELGTPAAGVIRSMLVDRGDWVHKGQVIAVLQDDIERASADVAQSRFQAEAEVRAAQAALALAQQRRDRSIELEARGFISAQALEQALAETRVTEEKMLQAREQKRALEKEYALAKIRLGERTIRSPFDGVVVERYFTSGERVEEKPMVRIAKVNPLRVEVILPSNMYGSVKPGSRAQVMTDLPGMAAQPARVSLVDKVLDAASGTYRARMLLPNADGKIPAGLRCRVQFDEAGRPADKPEGSPPPPVQPSALSASAMPLKLDTRLSAASRSKP